MLEKRFKVQELLEAGQFEFGQETVCLLDYFSGKKKKNWSIFSPILKVGHVMTLVTSAACSSENESQLTQ